MDHTPEPHVDHGTIVDREEIVTNLDRPPLLSWGALLGGLVFVMATSWLLNLLGVALGASIADASDGEAISNGLATGAVVWVIVSWLIAFFVGSLLTARLSGKVDSTVGMLHGMTLWGLASTLMLILSYWGITGLIQTGYSMVKSTASTAVSAAASLTPPLDVPTQTLQSVADTRLADNIQARLKRRASSVVARVEAEGGAEVSEAEVREAIEQIDDQTMQDIATHMVMGEMTAAREELTSATNLSDREVREILSGLENDFESQLNMESNETGLVGDISIALRRQVSDFVADLDAPGGASVSQSDVREALAEMDRDTMQVVAMRLMNGDPQGAKDALAANTSLNTRQINDIVEGVNEDVTRTVNKYQDEVRATVEAASTYGQAVLWSIFIAAAMGLAVSVLGGWIGAESSRQIEVEVRRQV